MTGDTMEAEDFNTKYKPTWCPGCGNYGIWQSLKQALVKLELKPWEVVIVYGIGCSGNMNDFVKSYGFHALHGRGIPNACGIKLANHQLTVICILGDGDCYGEGGNHLIHAARGNHDIKVFVHDNRVYGLTTGQTSPTSPHGYLSKSTPAGVIEVPLNPLSLSISQGASFVAQGFAGNLLHLTELMVRAIKHQGFSLLNILQPCVTFNKVCSFEFYQKRVYQLEKEGWSPRDRLEALKKAALTNEKIPIGVFYQEKRPTYHQQLIQIKEKPLVKQSPEKDISSLFKNFT